jgi:hypothetical protein
MRGKTIGAMLADPTIGIGITLCGLTINTAKPFRNDAFFLLLFVPNQSLGFDHHFWVYPEFPI